MLDTAHAIELQTDRQVAHWREAAARLKLDDLASPQAWGGLERYLGIALREHLSGVIDRLQREADAMSALQRAARSDTARADVRRRLLAVRRQYLRAEMTLDFFADAINTRTSPKVAATLRACDALAYKSMAQLLDQLDRATPVALTYLDRGLGASILKAGLRLWDGGQPNPVAAIKIVRHNIFRPTALIHEAGHQVAHITGWSEELSSALSDTLTELQSNHLAATWSGWASEIAADAFAFSHTGFASISALHDVLAGDPETVFRLSAGDPHPTSYLRVLLGVEMCRAWHGAGPWDSLGASWVELHPLEHAESDVRRLIRESLPHLARIANLVLDRPMKAFRTRSLRACIPPERVSPAALSALESRLGPALFSSAHWQWTEQLRILGLTGLKLALSPRRLPEFVALQEQSMLGVGGGLQVA